MDSHAAVAILSMQCEESVVGLHESFLMLSQQQRFKFRSRPTFGDEPDELSFNVIDIKEQMTLNVLACCQGTISYISQPHVHSTPFHL